MLFVSLATLSEKPNPKASPSSSGQKPSLLGASGKARRFSLLWTTVECPPRSGKKWFDASQTNNYRRNGSQFAHPTPIALPGLTALRRISLEKQFPRSNRNE